MTLPPPPSSSSSSMRKRAARKRDMDALAKSYGSTESCDKNSDCKGVHTWANGFEKLLEDPKGLQTFAEFLKKEFSHENIYFWAACERYKDTKDAALRRRLACQIYQRHLSSTAAEPVNVDSHASGQITQELLDEAPADLFLQAQKQVFNLMKFDSYPRFLRSELFFFFFFFFVQQYACLLSESFTSLGCHCIACSVIGDSNDE